MDKQYNLAREILHRGRGEIQLSFEEFNRRETRDLSGLSTGTGYYLTSQHIPDVLDALRPVSLVGQLPITVLSGLSGAVSLPRVATGTTGSTAVELSTVSESDPVFGAPATCQPLRLSTVCNFSRQLLAQGVGISDVVKRDLARGLAQQLDFNLVQGNGIPAGEPRGILNQISGTTNSFTFGTAAAWPAFLIAQNLLEATFVKPDHWVIGPATAKKIRNVLRGSSAARLLMDVPDSNTIEMIGKFPVVVTPHLSTVENAILGQWDLVYILIWGDGLELVVNPYTLAATGEIQVVAQMLFNICVRHPAALAISTDAGNQ